MVALFLSPATLVCSNLDKDNMYAFSRHTVLSVHTDEDFELS